MLQSARSRTALATAQGSLALLQQQYAESSRQLSEIKAAHHQTQEYLQTETVRRATAEEAATRIPQLETRLTQREADLSMTQIKLSELQTRIEEERKAATDQRVFLEDTRTRISETFKALSAEALNRNNQSFLDLARTSLERFQEGARNDLQARQSAVDDLVKPLREALAKVDGKIGEIEKDRVSAYAALHEQLRGLVETQLPSLRAETMNLVKALRQPTVRGRWGEIQLKRVVEMAGMLDHCDFYEQESRTTETGRHRPDLIVRLPGARQIVVDAKAPFEAYLRAIETSDDDAYRACISEHARQIRNHIVMLGRKGYWEQFTPAPEFVILFLPGEMFFSAALQQDPELIEFGVNERVIPATPTTLIALLRSVAYGWRQEALAKNAQEVATLGKQLYERIKTLSEHWTDVGARLSKAVDSYNKSVTTLESRVLTSVRRFKDLEAAPIDSEIETPIQIDQAIRTLQAPELALPEPSLAAGADDGA